MTLPITFSPPGDEHEPSIEDALQMAVWLMLRADNVNRRYYSFDSDNEAAGVKIVMDREFTDKNDGGRIIVPQQIVKVGFSDSTWRYNVSGGGAKTSQIVVIHLEQKTTEFIDEQTGRVENLSPTALMLLARTEETLVRGTLYAPDQVSNDGIVVDPFRSPLYTEDNAPSPELAGAYNPSGKRELNRRAPTFRRGIGEWFLPPFSTLEKLEKLDLSRDLAVAYFTFATYEVTVPDRGDMTTGGFLNA